MNNGVAVCSRPNSHAAGSHDQTDWVEGRDFRVDPSRIQDFCAKPLTDLEQDLVLLTAVVAFTDRRFVRHRGSGWTRHLEVKVPVSCPETWQRTDIDGMLRDVLCYATGDRWDFEFVSGFQSIASGQFSLDIPHRCGVVLPFSQGLDSYMTWLRLNDRDVPDGCLRVHAQSAGGGFRWVRRYRNSWPDSNLAVNVPIDLSVGTHPEPTYRTRSFVFSVMAAIAAVKFESSEVVIGEDGVSSLGPSILPIGDEHPNRGTFPGFTRRLAQLINQLLGTNIKFEHPNLFRTKGQILKEVHLKAREDWQLTNSCIRDPRSQLGAPHCGVCSGCLLRRTTLHTVGWEDPMYTWTKLDKGTLGECTPNCLGRSSTPNDEDIALHAIHSMESFAQLATTPHANELGVQCVAHELADAGIQDFEGCLQSIVDLCRNYREEWRAFTEQFPPESLIRRYEWYPCTN